VLLGCDLLFLDDMLKLGSPNRESAQAKQQKTHALNIFVAPLVDFARRKQSILASCFVIGCHPPRLHMRATWQSFLWVLFAAKNT
jgi:hypothetical protein